ncbi:MAG: hypothetical protein AAF392_01750 [Bacteroidota bacterium]
MLALSVLGGCRSGVSKRSQEKTTADATKQVRTAVIRTIGGWKGCTASCLEAEIVKKFKESGRLPKDKDKFPNKDYLKNLRKIKFGKAQDQRHPILPDSDIAGRYKVYIEELYGSLPNDIKGLVMYTYLASIGLQLTNDVEELVSAKSIDETKFKAIVKNFRDALKKAKEDGVALKKKELDANQISYHHNDGKAGNYYSKLKEEGLSVGEAFARGVEIAWDIYKCT